MEVKLEVQDDRLERQREELKQRALMGRAEANPNPNELHRGQTAQEGAAHDRFGSQPERVKHQYPNGNRPNSGSARSGKAKGQRRDNMSQGGE